MADWIGVDMTESTDAVYCRSLPSPFEHGAVIPPSDAGHILAALGPVVYALRSRDGYIKIGHTSNLAARRRHYSSKPSDLFGFRRGTEQDERDIHETLRPFRARGHEYYHWTPEVLAVVNDMREELGLSPLAA